MATARRNACLSACSQAGPTDEPGGDRSPVRPEPVERLVLRGGAGIHPVEAGLVEPVDVVDLQLDPRRELSKLLVVGDLEREEAGRGDQVALHRDRATAAAELEAAAGGPSRRSSRRSRGRSRRERGGPGAQCLRCPSSSSTRAPGSAPPQPGRLRGRRTRVARRGAPRAGVAGAGARAAGGAASARAVRRSRGGASLRARMAVSDGEHAAVVDRPVERARRRARRRSAIPAPRAGARPPRARTRCLRGGRAVVRNERSAEEGVPVTPGADRANAPHSDRQRPACRLVHDPLRPRYEQADARESRCR